jgi:hypothetical protein
MGASSPTLMTMNPANWKDKLETMVETMLMQSGNAKAAEKLVDDQVLAMKKRVWVSFGICPSK